MAKNKFNTSMLQKLCPMEYCLQLAHFNMITAWHRWPVSMTYFASIHLGKVMQKTTTLQLFMVLIHYFDNKSVIITLDRRYVCLGIKYHCPYTLHDFVQQIQICL